MIVLLSPAKTLDFDSPVPDGTRTVPRLLDASRELAEAVSGLSVADVVRLMEVSERLATETVSRFAAWRADQHAVDTVNAGRNSTARPALFTFSGEVYRGLDAATLSPAAVRAAQEHVRILSGLYGLLRPLDVILPYRLEMGRKLPVIPGDSLYRYWGTTISDLIAADIEASHATAVVNCASQEYMRAVDAARLPVPIVTPQFKERSARGLRTVGVYAKRERGRMARWIVENGISEPADIAAYSNDGYRFEASASTPHEFLFVR